ncbi:MAG: hypothetical protein EP330_19610 [Deltaproteobacteria bacterium]|nr:MAG: hypothetical protein EP330_19610 [Deltaproteobacteria bacterium]
MTRLLALALLLTACGGGGTDETEPTVRQRYYTALCPLYSDTTCVDNQTNSCGGSLSFDSEADCRTFLSFAHSGCNDLDGALEASSDTETCIADLEAFDCSTTDICDGSGSSVISAACLAVESVIETACPDDSGM